MNQLAHATSPALPSEWIDRIWMRLHLMYGNKFADMWRGLNPSDLKNAWAEDLAGYSGEELKRGLEWCKTQKWPPTLPEFMISCRPVTDVRTEWAQAVEQMRIRLEGKGADVWSRPQVYWAAVTIGWYDLNSTAWEQIKTRWANALENAKHDAIPEYRAQLPAPGKHSISKQDAEKRVAELAVTLGIEKRDPKAWARRIMDNPKNLPHTSVEFAKEALGAEA